MSVSQKFVEPISRFNYNTLPADVIEKAKLCILHVFASVYAGMDTSWSNAAREMTAELQPGGGASIWFSNVRTNMADAAFSNAVAAQSILYEDVHREINAHPGIIVIPAALAVGEQLKLSGKQILAAVVAGYEMMGRIGRGSVCCEFDSRGFRPTPINATFGSTMAAGLLLGLNLEEHLNAFGLAGNFVSGVNEWPVAGTDEVYIQNGMASRNGIIAAHLAKRGVTGPKTIIEGKAGLCKAYGFSLEKLQNVDFNDGRYIIAEVLFKPAPACALVQTTAQVAVAVAKSGVRAEDIAKGIIHTFALGKTYPGNDNPGPYTVPIQARMSQQYNFASSLIKGNIANDNYLCINDPAILSLASKMEVVACDEYTATFPNKQETRVELTMYDGRKLSFYREDPVYMSREEVICKLYDYCADVYGEETLDKAVYMIFGLEKLDDVGEIFRLFDR